MNTHTKVYSIDRRPFDQHRYNLCTMCTLTITHLLFFVYHVLWSNKTYNKSLLGQLILSQGWWLPFPRMERGSHPKFRLALVTTSVETTSACCSKVGGGDGVCEWVCTLHLARRSWLELECTAAAEAAAAVSSSRHKKVKKNPQLLCWFRVCVAS